MIDYEKQIEKNNKRKGYFDDYHHRMNNMEVQPIIIPLNEVEVLDDMKAY
jgi:hypothetical protein